MKKLSYLMCGLAVIGMTFTGCKDNGGGNGNLDNVIEDGFYCVGAATAVESITASNLNLGLMGAGTNELNKSKRAGMYEKYVYLLADKDFQLVLHKEGLKDVVYGAELKDTLAISDNDQIEVRQYKGLLAQNMKMKVPVSGLYHIILDLNEAGDLTSMGGAMIAVVPCNWGFRGDMNGWGFTEMTLKEASSTKVVYEYVPANGKDTFETAGAFKFAHSNCWKFNLDMAGQVKAENSIGTDAAEDGGAYTELLAGGKNIPYKRGIYDKITLTWELKGGPMAKSFTFNMNMCEALPVPDPATFVAGVSGGGLKNQDGTSVASWADPEGCALAVFDKDASSVKDQETLAGTYIYNVTDLYIDGEFKLRYNGAWLGVGNSEVTLVGVSNTGTDNFVVATGAYNIKMTVEWDGEKMTSLKAEFSKGKDPEQKTYDWIESTIKVNVATSAVTGSYFLYGWVDGETLPYLSDKAWPGLEATSVSGGVAIFNVKTIKDKAYKLIINNNAGLQSGNSGDFTITEGGTLELVSNGSDALAIATPE